MQPLSSSRVCAVKGPCTSLSSPLSLESGGTSNILSQHEVLFIKNSYALKALNFVSFPSTLLFVIARLRGMMKSNNSRLEMDTAWIPESPSINHTQRIACSQTLPVSSQSDWATPKTHTQKWHVQSLKELRSDQAYPSLIKICIKVPCNKVDCTSLVF